MIHMIHTHKIAGHNFVTKNDGSRMTIRSEEDIKKLCGDDKLWDEFVQMDKYGVLGKGHRKFIK